MVANDFAIALFPSAHRLLSFACRIKL